ncbi:MAG: PadR family transcriptional regulator [Oscillospiraceae bacterium]|nr:PadR family transcriptional regulator [Oscillospiraceae bacterium]
MAKIKQKESAKNTDSAGFKSLLKRASTEMLILLVLRHRPMYTYEMMNTLERLSDGYLAFNTLYIAIYRLRELLYIKETERVLSDDNRVRVYFSITAEGRAYLENLIDEYKRFSEVMDIIMNVESGDCGA